MLPFEAGPPRDPDLPCCGKDTAFAGACFSDDRRHRYGLWRRWDARKAPLGWCMLNPSKADADILDNTVTRCIDYAHESDAGGIEVVNLFPLMSTYPKDLIAADRDGDWDRNAAHILSIASRGGKLVLGFGVNPAKPHLRYALIRLRELLFTHAVKPYALSVTKDGLPKHPLYAKRLLRPVIYEAWPVWTRSSSGAES